MKLLIFELDQRGHHPGYLQHLIRYWNAQKLIAHLDVLISHQFAEKHPHIVALGDNQSRVNFILITTTEQAQLFESESLEHSFGGRIKRAFQEHQILCHYTKVLETTHCLIMYLDTMLLRLAMGNKLPCHFSCIYFRPLFHYSNFPNYTSQNREWLWHWRDKFCLPRLLNSSNLHTLFCLDLIATKELNQMGDSAKAIHLADPVQTYSYSDSEITQLKNVSQIEHTRHRSPVNFCANILCGLIAYCHKPKKPSLRLEWLLHQSA